MNFTNSTLEQIIQAMNARGLRLTNLFQLDDDKWQANVSDKEQVWAFGQADSAKEALCIAINIALLEQGVRIVKQTNGLAIANKIAPGAIANKIAPGSPEDLGL